MTYHRLKHLGYIVQNDEEINKDITEKRKKNSEKQTQLGHISFLRRGTTKY